MRSPPPSHHEPDQYAPRGRELLWKIWGLITERCLAAIQDPKCSPAWAGICVAWLKWNDVKLSRASRTAGQALASLKLSAEVLSRPFGVSTKKNAEDDE
jgi:hypothetical protein